MTGSRAQEHLSVGSTDSVRRTVADLSVELAGSGPDLLLVHGLSASRREWDAVAPELTGRFRLIMPDLAGRGESPAGPGLRFGLEDETERLTALFDELALDRPVVVGHSQGAALAVALAARRDCAGLLLLNPVNPWTARPAALAALRLRSIRILLVPLLRHYRQSLTRYILTRRVFADPRSVTATAVRKYSETLEAPERVEALLRVVADWRPAELAAYDARRAEPLLLVTGRRDRRAPPADVRRWAERLGGPCLVLEHCAHGVPEEAPDRVVQMILELDRTRSNGRTDAR
jgi:pimeloyl-ACP methyl ester carboxylesterase